MPLRSYLKSDEARNVLAGKPFAAYVVCRRYWSVNLKEVRRLGTAQGGKYVDGTRFTYEGGQIRSLLSLLSYFGKGEMRERSLGIKIPPTNLKPDFGDQARAFANELADTLEGASAAIVNLVPLGFTQGWVKTGHPPPRDRAMDGLTDIRASVQGSSERHPRRRLRRLRRRQRATRRSSEHSCPIKPRCRECSPRSRPSGSTCSRCGS